MKTIRRLMRKSARCFPSVMVFLAMLVLAGNARADVAEYECTQGLSTPAVVRWAKLLVDSGQAAHTQGVSIAPAGDGSGTFLVTGSAWTDVGENEYGLVVKMDQSGDIVDAATFFHSTQENGIYDINPVYNASQMLEGYITAGYKEVSHKWPGGDWSLWPDAWLLKMDLSLDMVWESTFGMQAEDWANAVFQNDAGYLFGGALRDMGPIVQGGWLFQADDAGNGLWSKSLYYYCSREDEKDDVLTDPCPEPNIESSNDTEVYEIIHSLLPSADGGCISGDSRGMQKLDSGGSRVWSALGAAAAVIEANGSFLGAGIVTVGVDSPAIVLNRVSAAGEVLWSTHYGQNASGPSEFPSTNLRGGLGVSEAANGGYIIAGYVDLYATGSPDLWLIKTLPGTEGEVDWALPIPGMRLHSARPLMMADDGDLIIVGSIVCDNETRLLVIKVGVSDLQAPEAAFSVSPEAPYCVDQEIRFDGSASFDPDGSIISYEWDYGDGSVGDGVDDTHSYAHPDDYTVTLKVTDNDGIPAFAQQTVTVGLPGVLWERTYANTEVCLDQTICTKGVRSYDIIEAVDGGFVISGRSNFQYSGEQYDSWLLKVFDNGVFHWEKNLTNDPSVVEEGLALDTTPDNGYAITGTFLPYNEDWPATRTILIKTDSRGNPAWHRIYGNDAGAAFYSVGLDVLSLVNGQYLVGGHTIQGGTDQAMWLLRTDADGWEIPGASRLYPPQDGAAADAYCFSIAPASPDGFVLTGNYDQGSQAALPVLKTDPAGDLSWAFHWPAASWNKKRGKWVAAVADGYVVAGQSGSNYGRAALMKVNADGSESAWVAHVPFTSHGTSGAMDGALTPDGGVVIVGWINEPNIYCPTKMFVAKFTGEGVCRWHQVFEDDANYAWGTGVVALDDGSILILGDECRYSGRYGCRSRLRKIGPHGGPAAAFDSDVREGTLPLEIQFSDLTSGGSTPYTYAWDFDNDGTIDSTEQNPVHTYEQRGTYSVRLDVTDDNSRSDTFICEDCVLAYFTGIYTSAAGVEVTSFSVTDDAEAEPETYDFQLAPDGLDQGGAFGFTLAATGPDGSHAFQITFPSPYDPSIILYKLPDWEEIAYTVIDAYTIEVVLDIVDGELDPSFVLAAYLPLKSLTISVEGNGTTDPEPGTYSYFVDDTITVTVTAIPEACWSLDQWSGAVTGSGNPISVELNKYSGDTSVTAHFVASALIAVDDDCDGDVDGSDLAALAAQGAAITAEDVAALAALLGEIE